MIMEKAKGPVKPPPPLIRRSQHPCKIALAVPTPTKSAPNIIDLAANMPTGLLLEMEVNKPESSKLSKKHRKQAFPASRKGKEKAPPSSDHDTASVSDEVDTYVDSEMEDEVNTYVDSDLENENEDEIMARQVALSLEEWRSPVAEPKKPAVAIVAPANAPPK